MATSRIAHHILHQKSRYLGIVLLVLLVVSVAFNIKAYTHRPAAADSLAIDDAKTMHDIEVYLDSISNSYVGDVKLLAVKHGIPSWGCGPSSFALAKILNQKFFNDKLTIDASYDNHSYEIVERFSVAKGSPVDDGSIRTVDHGWIEIYFKDKFLFVDPTIGQFKQEDKIAYQEFTVGDPHIASELQEKYGILDIRLKRLVQKAVNRVPAEQEPYPGQEISPADIQYYINVIQDRDQVDQGQEPADWKDWVSTLKAKYL